MFKTVLSFAAPIPAPPVLPSAASESPVPVPPLGAPATPGQVTPGQADASGKGAMPLQLAEAILFFLGRIALALAAEQRDPDSLALHAHSLALLSEAMALWPQVHESICHLLSFLGNSSDPG